MTTTADAVDLIDSEPSPARRLEMIREISAESSAFAERISDRRRQAVLSLRADGWTWAAIGDLLGISAQRVHQIATKKGTT